MNKILKTLLLLQFIILSLTTLNAQTLEGRVTDSSGEPLPFATIYLPGKNAGTATNADGEYKMSLPTGIHKVAFQYLGFKTNEQSVRINSSKNELNVVLQDQPVELQDVNVSAEREDPAYTIMRKAISKAKYHTQQLDGYTATVYIKGSGRLKGVPFLFRKKIEKAIKEEGLDSTTAFITESVSEIEYKRPNQYSERVISVRTIGDDNNTSPASFIQSSFYNPEINGAVSPLSPKAFAFYRFEYLGEFADRGYTINKIRVTPRSRGDNVFEGIVYIVDQLWSLHSLDLNTYLWGILFEINQIYTPVDSTVWLPVNNIFDVSGNIFGFKFEYKYFTNIKDYDIQLNKDLTFEPEIIDDKLEANKAAEADAQLDKGKTDSVFKQLSSGEEISRKELRKVMKEYEKQEQEVFESSADSLEGVYTVREYVIDSTAYRKDSSYWDIVRPIPLTQYELKGYRVMDSIAIVEADEMEENGDTISVELGTESTVRVRSKSKFSVSDILFGGQYSVGEHVQLRYNAPLTSTFFNTVEGINSTAGLRLLSKNTKKVSWYFGPDVHYGFSRKEFNYQGSAGVGFGNKGNRWSIDMTGGKFLRQLNKEKPISAFLNSLSTLLDERNYMKILEQDYFRLEAGKKWSDKLSSELGFEWSEKRQLMNHEDYTLIDSKRKSYTSNTPFNIEIGDTDFAPYRTAKVFAHFRLEPWIRYRISNGRKSRIDDNRPVFEMYFEGTFPGIGESVSDYSRIEGSYKHDIGIAGGAILNLNITAGAFLSDEVVNFPDFKHFPGNLTPFATADPTKSFRMMDYYSYSTDGPYLETHAYYQMRKFLATQILWARLAGLRESLFVNALVTDGVTPYYEVGYGLNYIFRFFRLEVVGSFQEEEFVDWGVRIGVATNFNAIFGN